MKQEQKPFEIKELFTVGFGAVSLEKMAQDGLGDLFFNDSMVKKLSQGLIEANAEIRRLREELREAERNFAKHHYQALSEAIAERDDLQQQLAAAPSWDIWKEREVVIDGKIYEVEFTDGSTRLVDNEELRDLLPQNQYNDNKVTRFRRLKYEPKVTRKWPVESEDVSQGDKTVINSTEQVEGLQPGFYMIFWKDDLSTSDWDSSDWPPLLLTITNNREFHTTASDGSVTMRSANNICCNFAKYCLIHAFQQPAQEVESTYWHNGKKYTLQKMTEVFGVAGVLASELLAAQRELAELKGKR